VSVIDTTTNTVVATIPLSSAKTPAPIGIAVTPDGSKVYITNQAADSVSVIDTATNTVTATIPLGGTDNPIGIAVTPDASKVYVANSYSALSISVIDTATNEVSATIPLDLSPVAPDGLSPIGVAVTPDGSKVYVATSSGFPLLIDTATNTVVSVFKALGYGSTGVAVTPDGSKVYVANQASNNVTVLANPGGPIAVIPVGTEPLRSHRMAARSMLRTRVVTRSSILRPIP
jgi:YVTN family beta-propeller protein